MKKFAIALALGAAALCSSYSAAAQQSAAPAPAEAPTTKLEAFSAKSGVVVIKGFSTVGVIRGRGSVTVDARELRDGANPRSGEYGVAIEVKEAGRLERESRSFIDYEEIDSLIRGIDYISKATKAVTAMDSFEAEYRTKGSFIVTVFSESSGNLSLAVSSGRIGRTNAFLAMSDLDELKTLLTKAKAVIDKARAAR